MKEFNANGHGDDDDLYLLEEGDISGASLHGKKPSELTVAKLKRWLSCRGAPLSGKKLELVERYYCFCKTAACSLHPQWRAQLQMYMFTSYPYFLCRVECYIKFGWDHLLVDPDKGLNTRKKLLNMAGERMESEPSGSSQLMTLLESLPNTTDPQWTESLVDIPQISFNAIFKFSVERKVPRKKVNYLENLADFRAHMSLQEDSRKESAEELYMEAEYTRTLDKAYRFFHDGHVQDLKFHPMPHLENGVCAVSRVLASMKKVFYHVTILACKSSCTVKTAYCTCPAGLSGCCNHTIATLYCLEDYVSSGLQEEEKKGCTERLQVWNRPNPQHVVGRPTDEVTLTKKVYGVEKRPKLHSVNKWDCRPASRRLIDPNKARHLRERLFVIEDEKVQSAEKALRSAGTLSELKKAAQTKSLISMYGTSGYLQMLDDEPAPLESREDFLRKEKEERLSRAAEKKHQFQEELVAKQLLVQHDHKYSLCGMDEHPTEKHNDSADINHLAKLLYYNHVSIDMTAIHKLEIDTRAQSDSEVWHRERKLRITASMMKEVCHRKDSTSCKSFLSKKLSPTAAISAAMCYGIRHEQYAIESYKNHRKLNGAETTVEPCGLFVDSSEPWLAASPDGIIF